MRRALSNHSHACPFAFLFLNLHLAHAKAYLTVNVQSTSRLAKVSFLKKKTPFQHQVQQSQGCLLYRNRKVKSKTSTRLRRTLQA